MDVNRVVIIIMIVIVAILIIASIKIIIPHYRLLITYLDLKEEIDQNITKKITLRKRQAINERNTLIIALIGLALIVIAYLSL